MDGGQPSTGALGAGMMVAVARRQQLDVDEPSSPPGSFDLKFGTWLRCLARPARVRAYLSESPHPTLGAPSRQEHQLHLSARQRATHPPTQRDR